MNLGVSEAIATMVCMEHACPVLFREGGGGSELVERGSRDRQSEKERLCAS